MKVGDREANLIIYALDTAGCGPTAIAKALNAGGYLTETHTSFTRQAVLYRVRTLRSDPVSRVVHAYGDVLDEFKFDSLVTRGFRVGTGE